uniref:Uncharacterized protein n=1 Tax=Tanacetum cinerariifolium TaxID=118510 RepID=A0A6L2NV50_TANCI|nr:hypothetical protein [Tanacetum cinerariifolium]
MDPYNHSTPISTKIPILDTGKFEQWKFRIQQYLQHERYALWEVIEFGDSYKAPPEETAKYKGLAGEVSSSTKKKGRIMAITAEDINIKNFGGNEATEKIKKNQLNSNMEDEGLKNHALMADEEELPIEYALMSKSSSSSDNEMGLPEFVDDTVTDYTRPTPSIYVSKSVSEEQEKRWKSNNSSFFEQGGSSGNVVSKPMIKFVKESGYPNATKVNNTENARKPTVKYVEMYRNTSQSLRIVDFLEASHIRYALMVCPTVYVSHIRQFWSTKNLAKVNGRRRTVSESSIKKHLKLNDEEDEIAFPTKDVRYGEAFPTVTRLDAGQHRENIAKTFAMPNEALPRVTSLSGGEGRFAQEDAPNIGGMDQGEDLLVGDTVRDSDKSADKGSDSTDEMANVLSTLGATNILASGGLRSVFTIASLSVATASTGVSPAVATTSGSFSTAAIFTIASLATPTTRVTRSLRGVVIGSSSPISINIPSISKKDKEKGK